MSQASEPGEEELFQYLLGEVDAARAAELERWTHASPANARRLAELRSLLSVLERPEAPVDLVAAIDTRLAQRRPRRYAPALLVLAAAAGVSLIWWTQQPSDEVRSKGSHLDAAEKWAGVRAYRLGAQGNPSPLEGELAASDGLLFAYTNGGPSPFTHLLVFGVGATGQVYWYYPAWLNAADDPEAIPIRPSEKPIELPERITQPLPRGRLVLHAVFSRRALRVSELERVISENEAGARLPLPDTAQQRYMVEVH